MSNRKKNRKIKKRVKKFSNIERKRKVESIIALCGHPGVGKTEIVRMIGNGGAKYAILNLKSSKPIPRMVMQENGKTPIDCFHEYKLQILSDPWRHSAYEESVVNKSLIIIDPPGEPSISLESQAFRERLYWASTILCVLDSTLSIPEQRKFIDPVVASIGKHLKNKTLHFVVTKRDLSSSKLNGMNEETVRDFVFNNFALLRLNCKYPQHSKVISCNPNAYNNFLEYTNFNEKRMLAQTNLMDIIKLLLSEVRYNA